MFIIATIDYTLSSISSNVNILRLQQRDTDPGVNYTVIYALNCATGSGMQINA